MPKAPHNEHELELALYRFAGSNVEAVEWRDMMAGVILSQMLPPGSVVKGGSSMRMRLGPDRSRVTMDFDAARSIALDDFIQILRERLEIGWNGFTGEVRILKQGAPKGVPFEYVMQPFDVKFAYRNHPWCTVRLEVGHNELGDADEVELRKLPDSIQSAFIALGFPEPNPVPLMALPFQIAQKLHGLSQRGSGRVRDMIDLQMIVANERIDYVRTAEICRRLFVYRRMQAWPPFIVAQNDWDSLYNAQRFGLPVLASCNDAIDWTNRLIETIVNAGR